MLNHEDPIRHIYMQLSKRDPEQNHIEEELKTKKLVFKSGYHVFPVDEIRLTNGEIVEALAYFTAQYHDDHYENIGDRGAVPISRAHWETLIKSITTPDGVDITAQVPTHEFEHLEGHINDVFNQEGTGIQPL